MEEEATGFQQETEETEQDMRQTRKRTKLRSVADVNGTQRKLMNDKQEEQTMTKFL